MRTEETAAQQLTARWSNLMFLAARGVTDSARRLLGEAQAYDVDNPSMDNSPFLALAVLACETHRHLRGHPCRLQAADQMPYWQALPGLELSQHDRMVATSLIRAWFEHNATSDAAMAGQPIYGEVFNKLSPLQRASVTAVTGAYAVDQVAGLSLLAQIALAQTYLYAPLPDSPHAHIYAALLADASHSGTDMAAMAVATNIGRCQGPVLADVVWLCLRTASAFVRPGMPLAVPRGPGCDCDDGGEAAGLMSTWAADIGAGVPRMREFLHVQVAQYATRDRPVAAHMLTSAATLLATTTHHETS